MSGDPPSEPSRDRVEVALAVPVRQRRVLVAKRSAGGHLGGTWEFPGGKIGLVEEPESGARRELVEETGLHGGQIESLGVFHHDYPERAVCLHVFLVQEPEGDVIVDGEREWAWLPVEQLAGLTMPEANRAILDVLEAHLRRGFGE